MVRPVLLKLGGSVLTDKEAEGRFRRAAAKRLLGEMARSELPIILLHGAGSFGHPQAQRHAIGRKPVDNNARAGVSEILASVGRLHADIVQLACDAGLRPVPVPLHLQCHSEGDQLMDLPSRRIGQLVNEGFLPVLHGTVVRDDVLGWRVVSADEMLMELAHELQPRLAVFATEVDGVFDKDPGHADAKLLSRVGPGDLDQLEDIESAGSDVTGRMIGKLERALEVATECPTWIVNGMVRGRLHDVLRGKDVPGTRVLEA